MVTREDYVEMVKGPGKFEGEEPYSPYFYYLVGEAGEDESFSDGDTMHYLFDITDDDIAIFPELKDEKRRGLFVHSWESDTGFWNTEIIERSLWDEWKEEVEEEGSESD